MYSLLQVVAIGLICFAAAGAIGFVLHDAVMEKQKIAYTDATTENLRLKRHLEELNTQTTDQRIANTYRAYKFALDHNMTPSAEQKQILAETRKWAAKIIRMPVPERFGVVSARKQAERFKG